MTREDAKDLTLSILVVVVVLLAIDAFCLHGKCARQADELARQDATLAALSTRLEDHLNPPPEPGLREKAAATYDKTKAAFKNGYKAVVETFSESERNPADKPEKSLPKE